MTNKKIKRMLDACYQAKRIREMLPPLPEGIMSSHIRYMDMIQELQKQNDHVRVSDLSDVLNIPRPGVTRTIKEMEKKGLVQKISSPDDGRVTYLSLTEHGKELSEKYNDKYFNTSIFLLFSLKANVKFLITSVSYDIISPHLPLIIA